MRSSPFQGRQENLDVMKSSLLMGVGMSYKMKISLSKYDKLWSKLVRERDGRCLAPGCIKIQYLNAHHIFPRSRKSTRLVLENGISLCAEHHVFSSTWSAHKTNETFKNWIKKRMGKKYDDLERLSVKYKSEREAIKEFILLSGLKNI